MLQGRQILIEHRFEDGNDNGWMGYDYQIINGSRYDGFFPISLETHGGVNDSGFVWLDDRRWGIDIPDGNNILAMMTRRAWADFPQDLRGARVEIWLRGENLDRQGGVANVFIAHAATGTTTHLVGVALKIGDHEWAKNEFVLTPDETLWLRSWWRDRPSLTDLPPEPTDGRRAGGTFVLIEQALAEVSSFGISFREFRSEVRGALALDEFVVTRTGPTRCELKPGGRCAGAELAHSALAGRDLKGMDLSGSNLTMANLTMADLSGANLRNALLTGADLRRAKLNKSDLSGASLAGAKLEQSDLSQALLIESDLTEATGHSADLRGAILKGAVFERADFYRANLARADLSGCQGAGANLSSTRLSGVTASAARLEKAFLLRADLSGADLRDADLTSANLSFATLRGADLRGASLSRTGFMQSILTDAVINRSDFETSYMLDAVWIDGTRCLSPSIGTCGSPDRHRGY